LPELDHLVVAARDLASGTRWLEERLGVVLGPGGQHATMGTHNRLLRLGEQLYLELIAIDPVAPTPGRSRWFGLDSPALQARLAAGPQLIHWVARSPDIGTELACFGLPAMEVLPMTRGDFCWRISVPADGSLPGGHGLLPTLIQWDVPFHPADRLPESACQLMKLEAFCADTATVRASLAALQLEKLIDVQPLAPGEVSEFIAYLKTPRGLVEISGSGF
jgi:hypothetical protein